MGCCLPGALLKNLFGNRKRGKDVGPARIKSQVGEHFRSLALRQTVIHRPVEMIGDLRHLAGSNEGADSHQAPVPRREGRTEPEITKEYVRGVLHDARGDFAEVLLDSGSALLFSGLIERQELDRGRRKTDRVQSRADGIPVWR